MTTTPIRTMTSPTTSTAYCAIAIAALGFLAMSSPSSPGSSPAASCQEAPVCPGSGWAPGGGRDGGFRLHPWRGEGRGLGRLLLRVLARRGERALPGSPYLAFDLRSSRRVHRFLLHRSVAHDEEHGDEADGGDEGSDQQGHRRRLSVIGPRSVHV